MWSVNVSPKDLRDSQKDIRSDTQVSSRWLLEDCSRRLDSTSAEFQLSINIEVLTHQLPRISKSSVAFFSWELLVYKCV